MVCDPQNIWNLQKNWIFRRCCIIGILTNKANINIQHYLVPYRLSTDLKTEWPFCIKFCFVPVCLQLWSLAFKVWLLFARDSKYAVSAHMLFEVCSERRTCFEKQCVMALQGHPRSLILAPIESSYWTFYWSSSVTLVLSCLVSEILQVFCWKRPHPSFTRIFDVFPLD